MGNIVIPPIDPEMKKISDEIVEQRKKARRKELIKTYLLEKWIDFLALIVAIIALIRTF